MKKNRKCICCKAQYSYCPNCNGPDKLKEAWYSEFCSEACKDLWFVATKFNMGLVNKNEAKEIISRLPLQDRSRYVECVQRDLENIFAPEPKAKRGKRAEIKIIDEVADIKQEVIESIVVNEIVEESHEVFDKTEEINEAL